MQEDYQGLTTTTETEHHFFHKNYKKQEKEIVTKFILLSQLRKRLVNRLELFCTDQDQDQDFTIYYRRENFV